MPQLEFCREKGGHKVTSVQTSDPGLIPGVWDVVYVPEGDDPRVYINLRVSSRQLYYDQAGNLAMVRLLCEDL
jgi:hypothetical protein